MATKKCPNGHIYDSNVYGDKCPFCPSDDEINLGGATRANLAGSDAGETIGGTRSTVATTPVEDEDSGTVIRRVDGGKEEFGNGRKLVAVMVCYDMNPCGDVFPIYEGRNIVGRKSSCDIKISGDGQVSSEHLVILYREVEGIFWAIDNNSSNGTFVNGKFENKVELKNSDIINVGETRLIFIPVPKIPAK